MIGTISTGKSFYHCLSYCMEDKQKLTEEQRITLSQTDGLDHMNRAEVLEYNLCFGNKYELADQFRDVQKLSKRVEKPVLHLSLRLSPGESLSREHLLEMGKTLAKEFDLKDRQYITILHKDTKEPHIHLVANRVGTSGKALSTSHNFLKMDKLCRRLEKEYRLKEVLSARRFLSKEQRLIPRHDTRKEKLKDDIRQTLEKISNYHSFQEHMHSLGYKILKARGISFIDDKKVKIKGSEVGFSLSNIERILQLKQELVLRQTLETNWQIAMERQVNRHAITPGERLRQQVRQKADQKTSPVQSIQKELTSLLHNLMKTEETPMSLNQGLMQQIMRKRKKLKIKY